ncbi:MAG: hypothetical protein V1835_02640 [Candidatus Micrarchaeota archaeon]
MKIKVLLLLAVVALVFSGCFSLKYSQKFDPDGSSTLAQEVDMSKLIAMQKSLSNYSGGSYKVPTVTPNAGYSKEKYDSLSLPESNQITMILKSSSAPAPGGYASFTVTISNNGETGLRDAQIELDSAEFVSLSSYNDFLGVVKPDEFKTVSFSGKAANVAAGKYPVSAILSYSDGNDTKVELAKTELFDIAAALPSPSPTPEANYDQQFGEACKKVPAEITCSYSNGILKYSKKTTASESKYDFKVSNGFPNIKYELEIAFLPSMNASLPSTGMPGSESSTGNLDKRLDDAEMAQSVAAFKAMGASIAYEIIMPGTITSAPEGEIKDNKAVFDVLNLMEKKKIIHVESEEMNVPYIAAAVVMALIVLCLILFKFVLKKPPATPAAGSYPAQQQPVQIQTQYASLSDGQQPKSYLSP